MRPPAVKRLPPASMNRHSTSATRITTECRTSTPAHTSAPCFDPKSIPPTLCNSDFYSLAQFLTHNRNPVIVQCDWLMHRPIGRFRRLKRRKSLASRHLLCVFFRLRTAHRFVTVVKIKVWGRVSVMVRNSCRCGISATSFRCPMFRTPIAADKPIHRYIKKDLYIEVSAHFGIESVENLVANRRNPFVNRYDETDNYLCHMLRWLVRLSECIFMYCVCLISVC